MIKPVKQVICTDTKDKDTRERESAIINQYDLHAKVYAQEIKENSLQSDSFYFLLNLIREVKGDLSGGVWLDAGCGPGCFSGSIFNLNYTKLIGVDLSSEMIKIARTKEVYSEVHKSSLTDLSMITKCGVSVYFSNNVFHFLNAMGEEYLDTALSEAGKVIKDNGLLAINLSSTGTSDEFVSAYRKVIHKKMQDYGVYDPATNPLGIKTELIRDYPIGSIDLKNMVNKLKVKGFRIVKALKRYEPIPYSDRKDYVRNMSTYAKHLYLVPFVHLCEDVQDHIFEEMVDIFLKDGPEGPFVNDHFMNYVLAIKCPDTER
ncbi:MAG: class I SAM-dependent methyltransferase [Candidatus Woesearchaeota archaeon]